MRAIDEQEQLAFDSEIAFGVLGRAGEFTLIPLAGDEDGALTVEAFARGHRYCGVLAVVDGQAAAKCEPDMDAVYTMMHAGLAFAQMVADRLKPKNDFVRFAEGLFRLSDTRA